MKRGLAMTAAFTALAVFALGAGAVVGGVEASS
jgi:hypothetical protein